MLWGLGGIFVVWLFFFTRGRKPRQFNYKEQYQNKAEDEGLSLSEKMYQKWQRVPYGEQLKKGKSKLLFGILAFCAFMYAIAVLLEENTAF